MARAAVNLNRFAIVYELAKDFVQNAVSRFGLKKLFAFQRTTAHPWF